MTGYSAYQLDLGPLEPSVLTQQLTHRSRDIWNGSVNMILNTRRCDGKFWDLVKKYPIHPRVLEMIELSRLYGVYRSNRPSIDRSLITSLVERCRPETHTFHFRTGEATITLQDVEVLYGLPVNGDPVLGDESIRTIGDWQNICQRLLGFIPRPQDFNRSSLKVTALNAHMLEQLQLHDLTTQEMIDQMARCYMFWMIACMMMADTSGNYLKLMYLPMLEDLNVVSSYSSGSATLAGPCATRWFAHFSWTDTTKHVLKLFRDSLDSMTEDQRVRAPIYCWDIVEVHLPDRVMRQFGLNQTIPTPFLFDTTHFHHDRRGRPNTNWKLEHAQWLPLWNQRLQYVCDAPVDAACCNSG
uniref:Aminotransferase-like plant mobile domain-containing protein n=1 Tax=Solanum lycopersicum TaxID=4081 RepID=A0A3Q7ICZ0_SOLLC